MCGLSPDRGEQPEPLQIPSDLPGKRMPPKPGPAKPLPHDLVEAGTGQMQKEFERTILKRYEEATALEKKKNKEIQKKKSSRKNFLSPCVSQSSSPFFSFLFLI